MSMQTIILAAGEASRMPNKALLPTYQHKTVIETAWNAIPNGQEQDVILVERPHQIIGTYLKSLNYEFRTAIQAHPTGITNAIRLGCNAATTEYVRVLYCDNVYPENSLLLEKERPHSYYTNSDEPHLDKWNNVEWVSRELKGNLKSLIGGFVIHRMKAMCCQAESILDFLNELKVKPLMYVELIFDIGTPESYERYIKNL